MGLGHTGEGWCRLDEGFISVPHTHPGDVVDVVVGPFRRGRAWAHVERFVERSPRHVDPTCPHYDRCSGCVLRHHSVADEAEYKLHAAHEILERYGPEFAAPLHLDLVTTGVRSGHRTRGRMTVEVRDEQVHIGLRGLALDRKVTDIRDCPAQVPAWQVGMSWIGEWLDAHVDEARGVETIDLRVEGDAVFVAPPDAPWTHPNPAAARLLVDWTLEALGPGGAALDLCCGSGTLTRALAGRFARIVSVDEDRAATAVVAALGLPGVQVRTGRLGVVLRKLRRERTRADVGVINPMRKPLGRKQLADVPHFGVRRLVYLGPAAVSAAKDAKVLADLGFDLARAAVIDLHPATSQFMLGMVFDARRPESA
jgi:tRNA/tmRNA/rRNA uracil-C5-methylase (TrmA/RlmC/RlmD family)